MKTKQAIIFESEKSVMQLDTMMDGHGNGLALSGSSISDWQIRELMNLDINEVVVGLDKDYKDEAGYNLHANLIMKMFQKLLIRFNVTVIFDDVDGLLGFKDSPTDCGKDVFLKMMRERKMMSL